MVWYAVEDHSESWSTSLAGAVALSSMHYLQLNSRYLTCYHPQLTFNHQYAHTIVEEQCCTVDSDRDDVDYATTKYFYEHVCGMERRQDTPPGNPYYERPADFAKPAR